MVLLTMTAAIVEAVEQCEQLSQISSPQQRPEPAVESSTKEPSLRAPKIGNPISHGQLIDISKELRRTSLSPNTPESSTSQPYSLENLLRGSQVYVPPPEAKKEPTLEYKALMARLRAEEEERQYERMLNPPPPIESFSQRFPSSPYANLFSSSHERIPATANDAADDEEITYADVNRQMALLANVLISIICCSVAIWMAASRWSTPKRLGLSMGGSGLVGVAEVVVYTGYLSRLQSAKEKERRRPETKTIMKTWAVGGDGKGVKPVLLDTRNPKGKEHTNLKNRKGHKT